MSYCQTAKNNGFSLTGYCGDAAILLAFNLDEDKTDHLAGFAIRAKTPDKGPYKTNEYWLKNRLNFTEGVYKEKELTPDKWTSSNKAPFQMFHWAHFPSAGPGQYTYTVYPCYFKDRSIDLSPGASITVDLGYTSLPYLELGFTRGYISSQAYADRFGNAQIGPSRKNFDFDTTKYQKQYEWLGSHARKILFGLLDESLADTSISLDVFAYDFYEPDIYRKLKEMKARVRLFQDDCSSHWSGDNAVERKIYDALNSAGVNVKHGHFKRFSHNKVIIQKRDGSPVKVLTGSTNFSLRGLYVHANSVMLFNDPYVAGLYEKAFEQAFNDPGGFKSSEIAGKWHDVPADPSPLSFSFAPHESAFTLDLVAEAIESAKSSVLFAIMDTTGGGKVLESLKNLGDKTGILSLGTIDDAKQLLSFKQGQSSGMTGFAYIDKNVPEPFRKEWSGGPGQHIHHKFVVCDFNDARPVVFCGSSNLSQGGETSNSDNLIAVRDPVVANFFAIEALRLYDHYRFRVKQEQSTENDPLLLDDTGDWVKPFYDPKDMKSYQRQLFCTYV